MVATLIGGIVGQLHFFHLRSQAISIAHLPSGKHSFTSEKFKHIASECGFFGIEFFHLVEYVFRHFLQGIVLESKVARKQWVFSLDFCSGTLDAFLTDLVDGTVTGFVRNSVFFTNLWPLYHNILSTLIIFLIHLHYGMCCCS